VKKCTKCGLEKPFSDFYTEKRASDKLTSACKKCIYSSQLRYREKSFFMTTHHNKASQCRRLNILYDLDAEYLESIWTDRCPVFDFELTPRGDRSLDSSPHLDRINPAQGYTRGNVAFISRKANLIKSNASAEDVLKVYEYMKAVDTH
jgi:hypothetical protein